MSYDKKMTKDNEFLNAAKDEAKKGLSENGIPIGAVLVINNKIISKGHNKRIQNKSPTLHAEMDCIENAGRLKPEQYAQATLYTTLSPCEMCSGAILLYKIPKVVIGENKNFKGCEDYLMQNGIQLTVKNDKECINMMQEFIKHNAQLWNEDIGEK